MLPEVDFRYRLPVYRSFITKTFPACSCWETTAIYHFNRCLVGEVINFSECGFSDLYVEILVEIRCFVNRIKIFFLSKTTSGSTFFASLNQQKLSVVSLRNKFVSEHFILQINVIFLHINIIGSRDRNRGNAVCIWQFVF